MKAAIGVALCAVLFVAAVPTCMPTPIPATATPTAESGGHMAFQLTGKGTRYEAGNTLNVASTMIEVPAGVVWVVRSFWADVATSAAGGNRALALNIESDNRTIARAWVPVVTPASQEVEFESAEGIPAALTYATKALLAAAYLLPWKPVIVPPPAEGNHSYIYVFDLNNIDPAHDTVSLTITYDEYRNVADAGNPNR
jgi:hypothetical protein